MSETPELTELLRAAADDERAGEALLARVYTELRGLAGAQMKRESSGHTLQATALVHEAWLSLVGPDGQSMTWENRAHFFGAAGLAMRR
ncbi:MAG: ECF-type sigma factor, partial [Planctomycetota bacterium]